MAHTKSNGQNHKKVGAQKKTCPYKKRKGYRAKPLTKGSDHQKWLDNVNDQKYYGLESFWGVWAIKMHYLGHRYEN